MSEREALADPTRTSFRARVVQLSANRSDEGLDVFEPMLQHVANDCGIHRDVTVHQDVAESSHLAELRPELGRQPPRAFEQLEKRVVGGRLAESFAGDDVSGDVEAGLNHDLKGVLDKPALAEVVLDSIGIGEFGELAQAGLDERESLAYQIRVGH